MPRVRSIVVAVVAMIGWSIASASPALAATVTVNPNSGLHDHDVVQVRVTGLHSNSSYDIAECQLAINHANPGNPGPGCDPDAANVMTGSVGTLTTNLTIHAGQIGSDPGSICNAQTNGDCGVVVETHGFGSLSGTAKISFAGGTIKPSVTSSASKSRVPAGKKFSVAGRVKAAGAGVNGLKMTVFKRANSHHKWAKSKTTKTRTIKGKAGSYHFTLKGLHHTEQYQVRHKAQHLRGTTYKAAKGKPIKIHP